MTAPSIVVVWVVAAELASPETIALRDSARGVLGARTEVHVLAEPATASAVRDGPPEAGIVRVTWEQAEHREAHVACYVPSLGRWFEQDVTFAPSDPGRERGRTLGFLIASMLMNPTTSEALSAPPARATRVLASEPPSRERASPSRGPRSGSDPRTSLGAGAEAVGPGAATAFGAWLGAERALVGRALWVGGNARARFGSIPEAQATTRFLAVGPTATWLAAGPSDRGWLGIKGGIFLSRLTVSHLSDDDVVADEQSRWLPGAELALHAGLTLTPVAGLFANAGVELLAGSTELSVRRAVVAVWSRASGLLRLGVQTRF